MMCPALVLLAALQAPQAQTTPAAPAAEAAAPAGGAEAAIEAGLQAFRKRRFTRAEIEFRRAVEADPGSAAAHFYLGYTYYKMGEPARRLNDEKRRAAEEFAKAYELEPGFRPIWGPRR